PIKIMADSGARGSTKQMRQLAAMRGSMFATNGKTMEIPIKSNFREGMKILEYFMGSRSSRKSLSDTALRTADSGYLTRRLVDVSQEVIVREECCDATEGQVVRELYDAQGKTLESLSERILGRYAFDAVVDANGNEIVAADTMITEDDVKAIEAAGIKEVHIRTLLKCHARHGVCAHCYGADLASGKPVSVGEAVGIIAAQSIGEPGTQLTMRTFHSGGVAGSDITQGLPRVDELFEARTPKKAAIICEQTGTVQRIAQGENMNVHEISVVDGETGEMHKYVIPYGMQIVVKEDQPIKRGEVLTAGNKAPADIMRISGLERVYEYIIEEIQNAYRSQGVSVNDKHIEIFARQMTRKVRIEDPGDTGLRIGSSKDLFDFEEANRAIRERINAGEDLREATASRELLGITKASLRTDSFLSAASFQETTRVLTEAAIEGKVDHLLGLKENVIIGKLIPAGTGMSCYRNMHVEPTEESYANRSEFNF
ncbi:MAG: DNA-directed RNA polymerase subunit beta', partial [Clostridia bacterium]|nr:DNA-directed RNA polymerase subunit beta' [Clostridia bacterium]